MDLDTENGIVREFDEWILKMKVYMIEKSMFLATWGYFLGVLTVDGSKVWRAPVKVGSLSLKKDNYPEISGV